jgi:hypothetical protein
MKVETSELQQLFDEMEKKNVTVTELISFIDVICLMQKKDIHPIKDKSETPKTELSVKEFNVTVDYSQNISEMIKAGNYGYVNKNITEKNFSLVIKNDKAQTFMRLFCFNENVNRKTVIAAMDQSGCRPADLTELVAFDKAYPDSQKEFLIVALGAIWCDDHSNKRVPVSFFAINKRKLGTRWLNFKWTNEYCFLGVLK